MYHVQIKFKIARVKIDKIEMRFMILSPIARTKMIQKLKLQYQKYKTRVKIQTNAKIIEIKSDALLNPA